MSVAVKCPINMHPIFILTSENEPTRACVGRGCIHEGWKLHPGRQPWWTQLLSILSFRAAMDRSKQVRQACMPTRLYLQKQSMAAVCGIRGLDKRQSKAITGQSLASDSGVQFHPP